MSVPEGPSEVVPLSPTAKPSDVELLARLEEANRLLEADHRSLHSLNSAKSHSRAGSISSVVSNTSQCSNYSNHHGDELSSNPEDLWEIWGKLVNDWDTVVKRKASYIRELVRRGIPHHFRGIVWQLLCNAQSSETKRHYLELLNSPSPCEKMIRRDITRTYPEHNFFKEKDGLGQESLFNVMKAYSLQDREVGYCQGSGFIVGLILMQMPEEEAFAVTVKIMQDYKMRDIFKPNMAELGLCMFQLECMIQEHLPHLYNHFQAQSFYVSMFASSWFLTLFTQTFPLPVACRIFDVFLVEGLEMIFRVGFAILQMSHDELLRLDMEGMIKYLQKDMPAIISQDPDSLLSAAFQIKFNTKKMKKLEKEYNALKSKEQEEQVELRRLRTENRLLRQRIDNLEKETGTLADRLIQDQVKYARQEEEIFILRRDLSVTKQHNQVVTNQLEEIRDRHSDSQSYTASADGSDDRSSKDDTIEELQKELTDVRHQAAESNSTMKELKNKITQLESQNEQLTTEPSLEIQHLQEELIASKLREAECNLSLKEMQQKVFDLDKNWKRHQERVQASGNAVKISKDKAQQMAEDLMAVRIKEAQAFADLKETQLKMMELETENHICSRQIKRLEGENEKLKQSQEEDEKRQKSLQAQVKDLDRKITDMESKRKEDSMMAKIKDMEYAQSIAEMRQRIAELEIENQELVTEGELQERGDRQELITKVADLEEEVLQLKMARRLQSLSSLALNSISVDSESDYDNDEVETSRLHLANDDDDDVLVAGGYSVTRSHISPSSSSAENGNPPTPTPGSDPQRPVRPSLPELEVTDGDAAPATTRRKMKHEHTGRHPRGSEGSDLDKTPTQDSVNNGPLYPQALPNTTAAVKSDQQPSQHEGAPTASGLTNGAIPSSNSLSPAVKTLPTAAVPVSRQSRGMVDRGDALDSDDL